MSQRPNSVLTQEQVDFFADNGYLHVKNVIEDWELELLQRIRTPGMRLTVRIRAPGKNSFLEQQSRNQRRLLDGINGIDRMDYEGSRRAASG